MDTEKLYKEVLEATKNTQNIGDSDQCFSRLSAAEDYLVKNYGMKNHGRLDMDLMNLMGNGVNQRKAMFNIIQNSCDFAITNIELANDMKNENKKEVKNRSRRRP